MRIAVIGSLCALVLIPVSRAAPQAAAGAATPSVVLILPGKLFPAEKAVPLGSKVTWINGTHRPVTVRSDRSAWPPFSIAAGKRHELRFTKVGRYRYHAGTLKGVIVVFTGGGTGVPDTIFHYDVTVTGHAQSAETWHGTTSLTIDWTTTFKNATFKKLYNEGGASFIVGATQAGFIEGSTDAKYTFDATSAAFGGPCRGTILLASLGTDLLLFGDKMNGAEEFHFSSQLDLNAGAQFHSTLHDQTTGACRGDDMFLPSWDNQPVAVVRGLTISDFLLGLQVGGERHDPLGPLLSPLKELASGDAFSFTTGEVQRSFSCGDSCNVVAMTELKVDVTPHR